MSRMIHLAPVVLAIVAPLCWSGCNSESPSPRPKPSDGPSTHLFVKDGIQYEEYQYDRTEYEIPKPKFAFQNDTIDPRRVPTFDPQLVHPVTIPAPRRHQNAPPDLPINPDAVPTDDASADWELNFSRTLFKLDVPVLKPDNDESLLKLRANYAEVLKSSMVLPSVNLINGQAKQFDDGLYAALDLAGFSTDDNGFVSSVDVVKRLANHAGPDHPASPFLAAGLSLIDIEMAVTDVAARDKYLKDFELSPLRSKPLGFYNWTPQLQQCYRFLKFFQYPFLIRDSAAARIAASLNELLESDPQLKTDYTTVVDFYSLLTNAPYALPLTAVSDQSAIDAATLAFNRQQQGLQPAFALFPPSTSREQRLFDQLFPTGFPEGTDLMGELVRAIRSGEVDLTPHPAGSPIPSGWYDYQCHSLETLLLPERGTESTKLLLSARYKQRMFDAFAALITKHRETHIRQLAEAGMTGCAAFRPQPDPPPKLAPSLRLEPNATYYLRTARSYAFLQAFLTAAVGETSLNQLHGLRESGPRPLSLGDELEQQRLKFYGFYLLSMEDIGLPADLLDDELANVPEARRLAMEWLTNFRTDPDLAVDTRVIVPVAVNPAEQRTQLWATVGVRLARLEVEFDGGHLPSIRPQGSTTPWKKFEGEIETTTYLIPVDEFVTIEISSLNCPTREQFRNICNGSTSTAEIIEKLRR